MKEVEVHSSYNRRRPYSSSSATIMWWSLYGQKLFLIVVVVFVLTSQIKGNSDYDIKRNGKVISISYVILDSNSKEKCV